MIQCASCGGNITTGGYCTSCGELYCNKHSRCPRCDHDLTKVTLKHKEEYNIDVDWLSNENITIGFNGVSTIPKEIMSIFKDEFSTPKGLKIIFFASKELSTKFSRNYEHKHKFPLLTDFVPEKALKHSRYSFIFSSKENLPSYILFNLESIKFYDLPFLFKFAATTWQLRVSFLEIDLPIVAKTIADIHFSYAEKLGIPFVTGVGDDIKLEIQAIYTNIISSYAEYLAIFKLYSQESLANISDFLNYKINTFFDALDFRYIDFFKEVLSTFSYYITICTILNYSKKLGDISNELTRLVEKNHKNYIKDLVKYPDLIDALESIIESNSNLTIKNIDTYAETYCQQLTKLSSYLEPKYESTNELLTILELTSIYSDELSLSFFYKHPILGTEKDFSSLLLNIFNNVDVNLKTRIVSGISALTILQYSIINDVDYGDYKKYILNANKLSTLLVDNIKVISMDATKKDHSVIFKFQDATNTLLVGSQLAIMFNEKETADLLLDKTLKISETYNLYSVKISVLWKKYTYSHNFSYIQQIYHNFLGAMPNLDESEQAYIMVVGYISKIFIEYSNWDDYFPLLTKYVEDIFDPEIGDAFRSTRSSNIYYYFIKILEVVLISLNDFSYVNKSKQFISGLLYHTTVNEPLNIFAYKTEVIKKIINNNLEDIENELEKITKYQTSTELEKFITTVRKYVYIKNKDSPLLFSNIEEWREIKSDDPWNRLLIKVIDSKIEKYLVFVEGEIDVTVLSEFSKKIRGKNDVIFVDSEGYTNMAIMIKDTKLAELQNKPTLYIFDGDTLLDSKRKKIRETLIRRHENISKKLYTLSRNAIEDYLLDSIAIKNAYPNIIYSENEIKIIIETNSNTRNKKKLLNHILYSGKIGKYDKLKAKNIAQNISIEKIDEEIKLIFSNIERYAN